MKYDPKKCHRRSIRLRGYDYAQSGAYFVAIYTKNWECLVGEVVDGAMRLNEVGQIARDEWMHTGTVRRNVLLDTSVVMPNHLHGVIIIEGDLRGGDPAGRPYKTIRAPGPTPGSIGAIIGQFKSAATKRINALRRTPGAPVWQRNYYEHVIRDDEELNRARQYLTDDPARWDDDEYNPEHGHGTPHATTPQTACAVLPRGLAPRRFQHPLAASWTLW